MLRNTIENDNIKSAEMLNAEDDTHTDKSKSASSQMTLVDAIKNGEEEIGKTLIENGARINQPNILSFFSLVNRVPKERKDRWYSILVKAQDILPFQKTILDLLQGKKPTTKIEWNKEIGEGSRLNSFIIWFVSLTEGINYLLKHPKLLAKADINAAAATVFRKGKPGFGILAITPAGQQLLLKHPELLANTDVNVTLATVQDKGKSTFWFLASTPTGQQILLKHQEILVKADVNAAPAIGPDQGKSAFWYLARTPEGRELLSKHPELLAKADVNAAPATGPAQGKSAFWYLANTPEGRELLLKHPELLAKADVNAAPATGPDQGMSAFWLLAFMPEGRQLLLKHPELLAKADVNAAPATGLDQGKFAFWVLATTPEGQQFIADNLDKLKNLTKETLCTPCSNPKTPALYFLVASKQTKIITHFLQKQIITVEEVSECAYGAPSNRNSFHDIAGIIFAYNLAFTHASKGDTKKLNETIGQDPWLVGCCLQNGNTLLHELVTKNFAYMSEKAAKCFLKENKELLSRLQACCKMTNLLLDYPYNLTSNELLQEALRPIPRSQAQKQLEAIVLNKKTQELLANFFAGYYELRPHQQFEMHDDEMIDKAFQFKTRMTQNIGEIESVITHAITTLGSSEILDEDGIVSVNQFRKRMKDAHEVMKVDEGTRLSPMHLLGDEEFFIIKNVIVNLEKLVKHDFKQHKSNVSQLKQAEAVMEDANAMLVEGSTKKRSFLAASLTSAISGNRNDGGIEEEEEQELRKKQKSLPSPSQI